MKKLVSFAPLLLLVLVVGCGDKKTQDNEVVSEKKEALQHMVQDGELAEMEHGEIPGDRPVWPEGTSFTNRTRDETIIVRTQSLDALYRRARETYGEELRGTIAMKFTIYPDGTIGPVRVVQENWTPPAAEALTDSMVQRVQQWTFPPGLEKPQVFTQPWKFEE